MTPPTELTTRPYYQDEYVTLLCGDCLDQRAWLDADVLITDPPYGINSQLSYGHEGRKKAIGFQRANEKPGWDTSLIIRDAALDAWNEHGERPYAMFGSPSRIDSAPPFRGFPLIWDKGSMGMGDVTFPWGRGYEMIYVHGEGWTGRRESPILRVTENLSNPHGLVARIGHPTPKPIALMTTLIAKAPPGVIADPFAGSGSTLVAAKALGRSAIGVEIDERYCEIAARRLSQGVLNFDA